MLGILIKYVEFLSTTWKCSMVVGKKNYGVL